MMWDYHVILVFTHDSNSLVFDLDTKLPFPVSFERYCEETFGDEATIMEKFHRKFRVISGAEFLTSFSSDRRHMKDKDGKWMKPPPSWSCIRGCSDSEHNLESFISMEETTGVGQVCNLQTFIQKFTF